MRHMLPVVLAALVALMSWTTLATAEEQSAGEKAVSAPDEERAEKKAARILPCEEYETDATGRRGKCLKHKRRKKLRGGFGPAAPRAYPPRRRPPSKDR